MGRQRMVSIIPGIETAAPLLTLTSCVGGAAAVQKVTRLGKEIGWIQATDQRTVRVTESFARLPLQFLQVRFELLLEARGPQLVWEGIGHNRRGG